jgi:hypothetical protein
MILRYGSYTHSQNEVAFTITSDPLRSQGGLLYGYRVRYNCRGDLLGYSSQQAITQAIQELQAAYLVDGNNLVFYLDDGVTPTAHQLISGNTLSGTRIVQPVSFPDTYGTAEYQTSYGRSYTFAIEGDVSLGTGNIAIHFTESLKIKGTGGAVWVYIPVAQGPWIKQQTSEQSTYRVVQSGSAVGLNGELQPPPPLFPDSEKEQERDINQTGPQKYGVLEWPVSWSYTFENTGSLDGSPGTGLD